MNGNAVKKALIRKIGPLPAWAWFLIGGVGLFIYRQRLSAAGSANDQAQVAASDGTTGYYGPYGQDNYPIDGGASTGGGSGAGTSNGGSSGSPAPPTIIVNNPPPAAGDKRTPKPKAQHANNKPATPNDKPSRKLTARTPRYHATTHNGRQHPKGSGKSRGTVKRGHSGGASVSPPKGRKRGKR